MKRFMVISILGVFGAMAQTHSWAAGSATPTGATAPAVIKGPKTPVQRLQLRYQHEIALIQQETKKGKLTAAQAKTLKTQVMAVHQQELTFLKADGKSGLTDAQVSQLTAQYTPL